MPPTSSNEEWADGRDSTLERDFDALANIVASSVVGYDEVELGNQMAIAFEDAWQACGVAMHQSNRPNGNLNKQVDFNMVGPLEFDYNVVGENVEGDNVDLGGYEPTQHESDLKIDDLHYLKLATKSKVTLYEGCALNRLTRTLIILNTCATHRCINGFVD